MSEVQQPNVAAGAAPRPNVAAGAAPRPNVAAGAAPRPNVAAGAAPQPRVVLVAAGAAPRPNVAAGAAPRPNVAAGAAPQPRVVLVDGVPMSALVASVPEPKAVIVAIHGGATSAAYFDCPGHPALSLLRAAAAQRYTAIALDRPGYGASAFYHADMAEPGRRVRYALGAVDKILGESSSGAGIFLLAHSAGCELGLRMAVDELAGTVLGIALAGTGLRYSPEAKTVISEATATSRPAGLRDLLWEPTDLYPPEVLTGGLSAPGAPYEAEVTANWPRRDFREISARVRVPVEFSVAEHERVWESTPEAIDAIAALFTSSPRVVVNEIPDSGHNLSVGRNADAYHQRVLSFVEECVASAELEAG